VKGLVYFDAGSDWLASVFRADTTKRPPNEARKSMQAFQVLLQRYPKSPYAADARQRAIFMRNRLADYELAVAEYYMKREAYVAAVNRARSVIETYDGSPAALKALKIMAKGYKQLGLDDLARTADSVHATNRSLPDIVAPTSASAGLSTGQDGGPQRASSATARAGHWEPRIGIVYGNSSTTDFKGGTTVDTESGVGFVGGVDYHFTERLSAGATLSYDSKDYTANAATDVPGETIQVKGSMDTTSLMVTGTYNFLTGRFTPLVTGGFGWSWVDTNIADAPPDVDCWWNPWYGYVCTSSPNTKGIDGFAYELGVGLRYDFGNSLAADGIYKMKWVGFDNATGTPSFDGFQVNLGWKF
jgi:opacity protein-like surface antigen